MALRWEIDLRTALDIGPMFITAQYYTALNEPRSAQFFYTDDERKQFISWLFDRAVNSYDEYEMDELHLGLHHAPWDVVDEDVTGFWMLGAGTQDVRKVYLTLSQRDCSNLANALLQEGCFTPNDYQLMTKTTAQYYDIGLDPLVYCSLGLVGEAGEVADKIKKLYRDHNHVLDEPQRHNLEMECGDVLWYTARLLAELDIPLEQAMRSNLLKLQSRQVRDVIRGNGDER